MLADAREHGILKRLRGTPLPASHYLAGRLIAAVLFASAALVVMLVVGVVGYAVAVMVAWLVDGAVAAARTFRWAPRD